MGIEITKKRIAIPIRNKELCASLGNGDFRSAKVVLLPAAPLLAPRDTKKDNAKPVSTIKRTVRVFALERPNLK